MNKTIIVIVILIVLGLLAFVFFPQQFGLTSDNAQNAPSGASAGNTTTSSENTNEAIAQSIRAGIVGTWQSTDDKNAVRVFSASGTLEERYEGALLSESSWSVSSDSSTVDTLTAVVTSPVLVIVDGDTTLHFTVAELTTENLTLIFLDRGGALSYTRVN